MGGQAFNAGGGLGGGRRGGVGRAGAQGGGGGARRRCGGAQRMPESFMRRLRAVSQGPHSSQSVVVSCTWTCPAAAPSPRASAAQSWIRLAFTDGFTSPMLSLKNSTPSFLDTSSSSFFRAGWLCAHVWYNCARLAIAGFRSSLTLEVSTLPMLVLAGATGLAGFAGAGAGAGAACLKPGCPGGVTEACPCAGPAAENCRACGTKVAGCCTVVAMAWAAVGAWAALGWNIAAWLVAYCVAAAPAGGVNWPAAAPAGGVYWPAGAVGMGDGWRCWVGKAGAAWDS